MKIKNPKTVERIGQSLKKHLLTLIKPLSIIILMIFTLNFSLQAQGWEKLIDRETGYEATTIIPTGCNNTDATEANHLNYVITLPAQSSTETYTFTIPLLPGFSESNCSLTIPNSECICTPNVETGTLNVTFDNPNYNTLLNPNFVTATIKATKTDGNWDEQQYQFKIKRKDIKLVLVLDHSGSMSLNVHGTSDSRWETLENAVTSFLSKFEENSQIKDSLGLVYFSTDVSGPSTYPPGIEKNNVIGFWNMLSSDPEYVSSIISTDMAANGPTNMTAVGKGLSEAKDIVNSLTNNTETRRVILLFTDGLQNTPPLVNDLGTLIMSVPTETALNDVTYPIATCDENIIHYYVITTLPTGDDIDYLTNLAAENCGFYQSVFLSGGAVSLTDLYDNNFQMMLQGNSPQIVANKTAQLNNGKAEFEFKINNYLSNILFELNFKTGDLFKITSIEKDGIDLTKYFKNKDQQNSNFLMRSLNFPFKYKKDFLSTKGVWKVKVSGESQNPFKLKCFVDDHLFSYDCKSNKISYTVGDTIHFTASLLIGNETLLNENNKVKVLLLKPGDDIGHLLATYATPVTSPDSVDITTPAEQKFIDLLQSDSSFYNALIANNFIIELSADEFGVFSGDYINTDLTGIYHAIFMIDAEDSDMGSLIRTKLISLRFKFGMLDIAETDYNVDVTQGDKGQTAIIRIKPKNKFGYYMGPGYVNKIKIDVDPKQGFIKDKKDNLDGSYTFTIVNIPSNIDPYNFTITIFGETLNADDCYSVTKWYYVILIIIILILYTIYKRKIKNVPFKILMWLILIVWIVYIILRYLEILCYQFL